MIRTTMGLIALFAMIAAACVAFGAYFSYVTLQNAHRNAVEARFAITADRIATTAQFAASLGIALPAQSTLEDLVRREARLDPDVQSIDILDDHDTVLFSSAQGRAGSPAGPLPHAVGARIENDLAAKIGRVVVRYEAAAIEAGDKALAEDLGMIALPTLIGAALATIAIGILLAADLQRAARRAAEPNKWPPAARSALASVKATHASVRTEPARQ